MPQTLQLSCLPLPQGYIDKLQSREGLLSSPVLVNVSTNVIEKEPDLTYFQNEIQYREFIALHSVKLPLSSGEWTGDITGRPDVLTADL